MPPRLQIDRDMKIKFNKVHTDSDGKKYLPGWVADWSQPDAERAIAEGFAVEAPAGAYPRKTTDPSFECAAPPPPAPPKPRDIIEGFGKPEDEFTATGEQMDLDDLTADKPKVVSKTAKFRL